MYTLNCIVLDCIELHSVDKMLTNEVKQEDELKPFIYLKKKKKVVDSSMNHFLMGLKIELKSALQMPRSSSEAKAADTPLLNEQGMQQIHKNQKEKSLCFQWTF